MDLRGERSTNRGELTPPGPHRPPSRADREYLLKYEYYMREADKEVLFSAYESDHPRISSMSALIKEPAFPIENRYLEALQALCKKHALADNLQRYHEQRWDDYHMLLDFRPSDCDKTPNYDFFEIVWENGARCEGTVLPREFRDFFSETVNSILPRSTTVGGWTCVCGYTGNFGKFCIECGAHQR